MFILDRKQCGEFDLDNAKQYVDFWSRYYKYDVKILDSKESIVYLKELNLPNKLTEENIKRLLRWKDARMLTETIQSGENQGLPNPRVERVLERIDSINAFRDGSIDEMEFRSVAEDIFPMGYVWRIFLFHIARPHSYPIGDQHVFRAYARHLHRTVPIEWGGYKGYIDYFFRICVASGQLVQIPDGEECDIESIVLNMKKVDNALFTFGQFLNNYP